MQRPAGKWSNTELLPIQYFFPIFLGGTGVSPVQRRLNVHDHLLATPENESSIVGA